MAPFLRFRLPKYVLGTNEPNERDEYGCLRGRAGEKGLRSGVFTRDAASLALELLHAMLLGVLNRKA